MANRARPAPMVIPRDKLQRVQPDSHLPRGREQGSVPDIVSGDPHQEVAQRPLDAVDIPANRPRSKLHIALCVPDLKQFGILKKSAFLIQDPERRDVELVLHILVAKQGTNPIEQISAFALTRLGLIAPSVAQIQYPDELQIGWSDDTAPINDPE